jgi:hypothetical protein
VIDDERFDRSFGRFELEAELFLERSEYRGMACWVGRGGGGRSGNDERHRGHGSLSRILDSNIESPGDSGEDDTTLIRLRNHFALSFP